MQKNNIDPGNLYYSYGTDTSPSYISDPDCSSRDLLVIHQCTYEVNTTSCNDSMDLTVNCCKLSLYNNNNLLTLTSLFDSNWKTRG